jgi:putative transposase
VKSETQGSQRDSEDSSNFFARELDPPPLICGFIDQMRARGFRVESICPVLSEQGVRVAAGTYRNWKTAAPSARTVTDAISPPRCAPLSAPRRACMGGGEMSGHRRRQGPG